MKRDGEITWRLEPQDEYTHTPDAALNYNESMYFNMFDPSQKIGGWFRIGNRPNEGYAEMSVCLYLGGGVVAFMFQRPGIANNDELNAGGMRIEVLEPFKRLRLTYDGDVLLMRQPTDMSDPRRAFQNNPLVPCRISLMFNGVSPMYGGEPVLKDGKPIEQDAEASFARAHYEQHTEADGFFQVDGRRYHLRGFGLRDKSWGPRYWQSIPWYRWCPMNFGRDFAMMISLVAGADGTVRRGGMILKDGAYRLIKDARVTPRYDNDLYQTDLDIWVQAEDEEEYTVTGRVLSLVPLRNRRKDPDGQDLHTRITEGMTEYRCNGMVGYGLSEFLDQLENGRPVGYPN